MGVEDEPQDNKLTSFKIGDEEFVVKYGETMNVKEGVVCDTYIFVDDESRDLAVVTVAPGASTPIQRVLNGETTQEGHISGVGKLTVSSAEDSYIERHFLKDEPHPSEPIIVDIGKTMQWTAGDGGDLVFYEICTPPYQDGRFENISE